MHLHKFVYRKVLSAVFFLFGAVTLLNTDSVSGGICTSKYDSDHSVYKASASASETLLFSIEQQSSFPYNWWAEESVDLEDESFHSTVVSHDSVSMDTYCMAILSDFSIHLLFSDIGRYVLFCSFKFHC
ncbi:MAG: hypothetical protein RLZZ630_953 [Bacteroidota bacterium]